MNCKSLEVKVPEVGDDIYVPTQRYLSHGVDDVVGGLAEVVSVSSDMLGTQEAHFVSTREHPGNRYNWEGYLALEQEKLKERFGDKRAYPDPDYSPDSNRWD